MKDFGNILKVMNRLMDAHYKLYEQRRDIAKEQKKLREVMFFEEYDEATRFFKEVVRNRYIKLTLETHHINMDMYKILHKYGQLKKWLKGY